MAAAAASYDWRLPFVPRHIFGVDFSGAKNAGETTWIARAERSPRGRLRLVFLGSLASACGEVQRREALGHLVELIRASQDALWAMDFPFSLPVEILHPRTTWASLLRFTRGFDGCGYDFGHWCLARAKARGGANHVPRLTDAELKAPFSCYHYRISYQTFHGMRDVLRPLADEPRTAVLPFQGDRLRRAARVLVEACPSSTLKKLSLPHHNYKQPLGGPLTHKRRRTRRVIVGRLAELIEVSPGDVLRIMRDPGGDALDAVIAAVGAAHAWERLEHGAIAKDARRRREGWIYAW
jgi:hypothetical protein